MQKNLARHATTALETLVYGAWTRLINKTASCKDCHQINSGKNSPRTGIVAGLQLIGQFVTALKRKIASGEMPHRMMT